MPLMLCTQRVSLSRCFAGVLLWLVPLAAQADILDLGPVPAQGPILIPTPAVEGEIWIEIGTIDVTAFAQPEGETIRLSGFAPLPGGPHNVTVHMLRGAHDARLAEYRVTVAARAEIRHTGALTVTATNHSDAERVTGDVAGLVSARSGGGTVTGGGTFLGSTDPEAQPNGRPLEMQDYLITLQRPMGGGRTMAHLGHHAVSPGTLLIDDRARRGLSLGFASDDQRASLTAFAMRASDIVGAEDILGLNDRDDRITGLRMGWAPSAQVDLRFALEAYQGRGATYFADGIGDGRGVALSADGSARSGALRYGLAAARTGWDDDAEAQTFSTLNGNAFSGYLEYDLDTTEDGARVSLGAEFALVDYYYFGLGNPSAATGVERYALSLDRSKAQNWQRVALSVQTDARAAPGIVPQNRVWEASLDGQWNPPDRDGALSLTYGLAYLRQDRIRTPDAAPPAQDYAAMTAYVGLAGWRAATSWAGQLSVIDENDRTDADADRTSVVLDLGVSHAFSPAVAADAALSLTHTRQTGGSEWDQMDVSLGLGWELIPSLWTAAVEVDATFTDEPLVEDGAALVLTSTHRLTDRLDLELAAAHETGGFTASGQDRTTAAIVFRLALDAPRS